MALHLLDSASVRHVEVLPPPVGQRKFADSALLPPFWLDFGFRVHKTRQHIPGFGVLPGFKCYDKARQGVALKVSKTFQMI